ncbi:MAG: hypothetical protein HQM15_04855 [Deltaproteobacteria bacterium]|nr:hypothetical protein [Deltaproteobacteria bacterium]
MKIKTYLVRSLSEAVEKIKKEMGPEAVILSTRKVEPKTHPLADPSISLEVTAALYPVDTQDFSLKTSSPKETFQETVLQAPKVKQGSVVPVPELRSSPELRAIPELSPIQAYFAKQNQRKIEEMERAILSVCRTLNQHELQSSLIHELSEKLLSECEEFDLEKCEEMSAHHLMKKMPKPLPFKREGLESTQLAFVGPTGSGKTTTLTKLALKYKLEGCSIAIVSIDYDILHRQEPLRRFAEENEIPFYFVTHESELVQNLTEFANYEVVLFDTEGCSPYDNERMARLAKTCENLGSVQTALVLPTHLGFGDLFSIMRRFSITRFDRLILTKLDETENFGNLFHAPYYSQVPLAYFTMGQRIPEDIEEATLERIMDCFFNFSARGSLLPELPLEKKFVIEKKSVPEMSLVLEKPPVQEKKLIVAKKFSSEKKMVRERMAVSVRTMPEGAGVEGLTFL